ncbi:hypothetical protein BGZ97_010724, partial [Linnemannia gamsii]
IPLSSSFSSNTMSSVGGSGAGVQAMSLSMSSSSSNTTFQSGLHDEEMAEIVEE